MWRCTDVMWMRRSKMWRSEMWRYLDVKIQDTRCYKFNFSTRQLLRMKKQTYAETLLHTNAFYTQTFSYTHAYAFTRSHFYTRAHVHTCLRTDAFTHQRLNTHKRLNTHTRTHSSMIDYFRGWKWNCNIVAILQVKMRKWNVVIPLGDRLGLEVMLPFKF